MSSRVIRTKGVEEYAMAAGQVRRHHPNAHFLLVGPADEKSLDRLSPQEVADLRGAVNWPGPRSDIPQVLAASDLFVLPTFYPEGIPRVLLEAASMGLPLVATRSPGCVEVVEDGVNGYLVPVRDPTALAAYVQIVNAYCALGKVAEAKTANERAKWLLRRMPPENFSQGGFTMPKEYWDKWLQWTSAAGMW